MQPTDNPRIFKVGTYKDDALFQVFQQNAEQIKRNDKDYHGIVIHTADYKPRHDQHLAFAIDDWHRERGWDGIGYAFVVEQDGTVYATNRFKDSRQQAHCLGHGDFFHFNRDFLGICIAGKGTMETMTLKQKRSTAKLVYTLAKVFDIPKGYLFSHAVLQGNKHCPGFYVAKDLWVLHDSLNKGVAKRMGG
jgi:N-acetylmuramoyl-L-alanine amidase